MVREGKNDEYLKSYIESLSSQDEEQPVIRPRRKLMRLVKRATMRSPVVLFLVRLRGLAALGCAIVIKQATSA